MTSDTIINGKTQTSLLRFFSGEAAVTQAIIFSHWSHLQNLNGQEVCIATLMLCALHLLQKRLN